MDAPSVMAGRFFDMASELALDAALRTVSSKVLEAGVNCPERFCWLLTMPLEGVDYSFLAESGAFQDGPTFRKPKLVAEL
jgi:hypothetical protein